MKPHRHHTAGGGSSAMKYRLMPVAQHRALVSSILSMLTTVPNHPAEAAVNAVILHRYADIFDRLQHLLPQERIEIADKLARMIEVHVCLDDLQELLNHTDHRKSLQETHTQQCAWLIQHGAGNSMIQRLCFTVEPEDIKQMRLDLDCPVNKGRCKSLPLDDKLSVLAEWKQLSDSGTDEFTRWQKLADAYPAYDIAQLYAAVNDIC